MERAVGSMRFLAFILCSAFVASSIQLAVSDTTGIGASGFVYAIFGFMWVSRQRFPQFNEVLTQQTIKLFIIWLFGCLVATYLKVWNVGNAAHFSGLVFGAGVGEAFVVRRKLRLTLTAIAALIVLCLVSLVWCPWSVSWLSDKAYHAHVAKQFDRARDYYSRIIRLEPNNAWAYQNRSYVLKALGSKEEAKSDLEKARALDPSVDDATK